MSHSDYRQASTSENFPYDADTVPYILIKGGKIAWANKQPGKLALLRERGGKILAVWPGQWSSDVFEIDDRIRARAALGDESALKVMATCKHQYRLLSERQDSKQTRSIEVELTCGCEPDHSTIAALDMKRQLSEALGGVRIRDGYASTGSRWRFDIAAGPNQVLKLRRAASS
jgi:hypothetical protein